MAHQEIDLLELEGTVGELIEFLQNNFDENEKVKIGSNGSFMEESNHYLIISDE